jgi:2-phospho-L-lactate guanylyltransferase
VRACAIVPQKPLALAKSRLGTVLPARGRATLSLALLRTVCTVLRATPGVEDVVVMTPDAEVQAFAAGCGIKAVPDPAPDLNDALVEVFRSLPRQSHAILVVSADLPLLLPADAVAMLAVGETGALVLAPARDAAGTNALLLPPETRFHPAFGRASRAAHRARARALGLRVVEVHRPGLAFDVDTPADLTALEGRRWRMPVGEWRDAGSGKVRRLTL